MPSAASFVAVGLLAGAVGFGPVRPDDREASPGEWGFRPQEGEVCSVNPPGFVVRLQAGAERYEFVIARDALCKQVIFRGQNSLPCFCPSRPLPRGRLWWRYRFRRRRAWSAWSKIRHFTVPKDAVLFPAPSRLEVFRTIPGEHPRLFLRPDMLAEVRAYVAGAGRRAWEELLRRAEEIVLEAPAVEEPPRYPPGVRYFDPEWHKLRAANRQRTVRVLGGAFTLGVVGLVSNDRRYLEEGKRLLLAAASWNPYGSTGYRYNDRAALPYTSLFARSYTFLHSVLSEEERARCEKVARVRGRELYLHLCPQHLWRPYRELACRSWHVLGELGIAFFREVPEAKDWLHFALNVFFTCYPVWAGRDGGWHEGLAAWKEEMAAFVEWAATLKAACGVDAYRVPFLKKTGFYPLYALVPRTEGGGFGQGCEGLRSRDLVPVMATFARYAGNPYWQWYVDAHGVQPAGDPLRQVLLRPPPPPAGKDPADLPSSRLFRDIGVACLNSTLRSAKQNVAVLFKSSPFGSAGRGYEAQNSFLLYGFGKRFLIRSGSGGLRDLRFQRAWLWQTRSVNSLTFDGVGQRPHEWRAAGRIVDFADTERVAYVRGEAAEAYEGDVVRRFTRHVIMVKGRCVVLWDEVELNETRHVTFHLHAPRPFSKVKRWGPGTYEVAWGDTACVFKFFWGKPPEVGVSEAPETEVRPPVKLTEWHLWARTPEKGRRFSLVTFFLLEDRTRPDPYGQLPQCRIVPGGKVFVYPTDRIWSFLLRSAPVLRSGERQITEKVLVQATDRGTNTTRVELARPK